MQRPSQSTRPIADEIADAVGDGAIDVVCHRTRTGPLDDPVFTWTEYDSLTALPDEPLDGWEEVLVFTDTEVYQWSEMGYGSGPTVVPRRPDVVLDG